MVEALPAHLLRCPPSTRSRVLTRGCANAHDIYTSHRAADTCFSRIKPLAAVIATLACLSLPNLANAACYKPGSEAQLDARQLDWVPLSELTPAQRALQPTACCGAYITPARSDGDALADPATSTLRARADSSDARLQSEIVMRGNVEITQGYRAIRADNATYNQADRKAEISGDIQMREPGLLLRAERATVDIDDGNASLEQAQFVLHETRIRGEAERLEKFGERLFRLEDSRFTSCEPGSKLWSISGSEINIYPEDHYGTARNMRLNIMDVPLVYLPYARFPVGSERLTGFLFPSMGFDRRRGLDDVEIPFYWNMAPNYDMTLTPRYMAEHGGILDIETRHLSPQFETLLDLSYMASDLGNYTTYDEQRIADGLKTDYSDQERWMFSLDQTGGKSERWSTRIDYTDISDTDYLLDINGSALDENRQANITQLIAADYQSDNWLVGIQTEEFRLLTETQLPYRELPRIQADGDYRLANDWQLTLDHEYIRFDRNSNFTGNLDTLILGERLRTNYQVAWDKDYMWGFFKPAIGYKTLNYQLDNRALNDGSDNAPSIRSPQASLDTGLYFERDTQLGGNAFVQTLEPRLFYLHSDYQDHSELYGLTSNNRYINFDTAELTFSYNQLFRDTRFSGGDRLDDANQVTVGVSSAWIEQSSGVERLRLSIGQVVYFDDRQVFVQGTPAEEFEQSNTSPVAAQISARLGSGLRISSDLVYNHETNKMDGGTANVRFMDKNYRILNLGYRYTRNAAVASPINPNPASTQELDQVDASVIWPVSSQWAIIARSNYDFRYDLELDTFAGLEYNDCCYRVRVMARRWLNFNYDASFLETATPDDYREGVFLDIQLKGLGNIGERVSSLLDKAIFGYSEREKNLR